MRKVFLLIAVFAVLILVSSCETMDTVMRGADVVSGVTKKTGKVEAAAAAYKFREGEVLCSWFDNYLMIDNRYFVAKILTQPSADTKNQAEVLFIKDGEQKWSKYVIPSHKADKSEMELGKIVLFHNWASSEDFTQEQYRKESWHLGRISSTDDLFKDMVEVKGAAVYVKWLRIPEVPIEE